MPQTILQPLKLQPLMIAALCLLAMMQNAIADDAAVNKKITELKKVSDVATAKFKVAEKNLIVTNDKLKQLQNDQHAVKLAKSQADIFLKNVETLLKEKQKTLTTALALKTKLTKSNEANQKWLAGVVKSVTYGKTTIPLKKTKLINIQKQIATHISNQKKATRSIAEIKKKIASSKKKEEKTKHQAELNKLAAQLKLEVGYLKKAQAAMKQEKKDLAQLEKNYKKWIKDNSKVSAVNKTSSAQLAEAVKKWMQATADIKTTTAKIASSKKTVAETPAKHKKFTGDIKTQLTIVSKATQVVMPLQKDATSKLLALEKFMLANGRMVSFANEVAPVFMKKCVICHSHKKAEGRFNMQTFAEMIKGGESGVAIDLEDPEFSSLLTMIEDGSMPKDADPLPKSEIAIIKKWLTTGAQAGAEIDQQASLIKIIPTRKHPLPPPTYRASLPVTALAFNPTGTTLASSGYHEVLLWNSKDGTLKQRISGMAQRVLDIEFSPDGSQLAIAATTPGEIGEVKLYDGKNGKLLSNLLVTEDAILSIAFRADGRQLAAAGADHLVHIIDIATKKEILTIKDHSNNITDIIFSPDGSQLATACQDKTVRVFDAKTGEVVKSFTKHNTPVNSVAFTPDGKQIISGAEDRRLRLWNISDAKEARSITGFSSHITRLVATPDGMVFSVNKDRRMYQHQVCQWKIDKTVSIPQRLHLFFGCELFRKHHRQRKS